MKLARICFEDWTPKQFAALDVALGGPGEDPVGERFDAAPATVRALVAQWWAQLHGLTSLEILGRLRWTRAEPSTVYEDNVNELADRIIAVTALGATDED